MSLKHCRNKIKPMATSMSMRRPHSTWELDITFNLKWLDYMMHISGLNIDLDQLCDEATPWFMLVGVLESSFFFLFENLAHMQCILGSSWYNIKVAGCNTWSIQMTSLIKRCGDTYNLHQSISLFAYFLGICRNSRGIVILVGVAFLSFAYIGQTC